jgi:hypothetical protein
MLVNALAATFITFLMVAGYWMVTDADGSRLAGQSRSEGDPLGVRIGDGCLGAVIRREGSVRILTDLTADCGTDCGGLGFPDMARAPLALLVDVEHGVNRAEEARVPAEQLKDPDAKHLMVKIAEGYDKLAQRAQERRLVDSKQD